MGRRSLGCAAIIAIVLPLAVGLAAMDAERGARPARRAFLFEYTDINPRSATYGQQLALTDLYRERGVVLNFIASWCAPCWEEIPSLQRLRATTSAPIVCVAADEYGPTDDLLRLAANAEMTLPILHVPREQIQLMERHYDHEMIPATYVIDRTGRITRVIEGMLEEREMTREILDHLPPPQLSAE